MSSISDIGVAFAQNKKVLHDYYGLIPKIELPVFKGYFLSDEDLAFRRYILNLSCQGSTKLNATDLPVLRDLCFPELEKREMDGLIEWNEKEVIITSAGRHFIRNICSAFDLYLQKNKQETRPLFSKAI